MTSATFLTFRVSKGIYLDHVGPLRPSKSYRVGRAVVGWWLAKRPNSSFPFWGLGFGPGLGLGLVNCNFGDKLKLHVLILLSEASPFLKIKAKMGKSFRSEHDKISLHQWGTWNIHLTNMMPGCPSWSLFLGFTNLFGMSTKTSTRLSDGDALNFLLGLHFSH